jgi:transposase, IS6 family
VKVAGQWRYVYRVIDQFGQVIDVFVASWRDTKAAHRFLRTGDRYDPDRAR